MKTTLVKNDEVHLEVEEYMGDMFIHLQVYKWSKSLFKKYLEEWVEILDWFKSNGVDVLYVIIPDDDPKLLKFETMFGFEILIHCSSNHQFLMCQEI